ncbi:MAG: nucleoside recognition domain-containing protein [Clostridia bacterium]|nr:nucleoside recognition domain-containing protein [Clostridia bacterium]
MNKIWLMMMLSGTAVLLIVNPSVTITTLMDASASSVELCISLCAIYAVWLGLLEILDKSGLADKLAKLLRPVIRKLFKVADDKTHKDIAVNLSANMLGLGNAATPYGIKAMKGLDDGSGVANQAMIMLMVLNATSIQLIPTTTIGLRAAEGSTSPTDIILPTLIATFVTCLTGIILVIICGKIFRNNKKLLKK